MDYYGLWTTDLDYVLLWTIDFELKIWTLCYELTLAALCCIDKDLLRGLGFKGGAVGSMVVAFCSKLSSRV